jgi:hypothetical protein
MLRRVWDTGRPSVRRYVCMSCYQASAHGIYLTASENDFTFEDRFLLNQLSYIYWRPIAAPPAEKIMNFHIRGIRGTPRGLSYCLVVCVGTGCPKHVVLRRLPVLTFRERAVRVD